jgi:hypothetical protein
MARIFRNPLPMNTSLYRYVCFRRLSSSDEIPSKHFTLRLSSSNGQGLFSANQKDDVSTLVENFTAPALATALRDREDMLHVCAELALNDDFENLKNLLKPFLKSNVIRRQSKRHSFNLSRGFEPQILSFFQRTLHRMPRQVYQVGKKRASVVIPLCNVQGEASVLFERRSEVVRTHKLEVSFQSLLSFHGP